MYTPILATLGYILSPDHNHVLMIHRNKRPDDQHYGKYNGLGGKLQTDEDVATCMKREILEESGLIVDSMQLRGTISWPGFGKHDEAWFGFIFLIDQWHGETHRGNSEGSPEGSPEGSLEWISLNQLDTLPLWPSDHMFLPMVFDNNPRPFHGHMPFKNGKMVSWHYTRL